ncbi:hypothetical protein BC938DRAFT_480130 [Jimgerdemannia flammicorona]|uniref:NB-ARC domain-containing protein n=1 Tax=Jimgerdemannia flammicorona TaxID=994334 RepID=A0A433QXJ9_9FUNG|nr:hypothetical protein BC938DRAFT_480130 [Jimgerdemannia flammicorona]
MEQALSCSNPSSECKKLALTGQGGMSKTQLMLRYCYHHSAAYDFVFWLEVDSRSTAILSFRKLAISLGLNEETILEGDSEVKAIRWVRSWLQERTK